MITRYLSQQTDTEENEKLTDWLAAAPENEAVFEDIKTVWLAAKVSPLSGGQQALQKLRNRIEKDKTPNKSLRLVSWISNYGMAASLTLILLLSGLLYAYNYKKTQSSDLLAQITKTGQKKIFFLQDGTKVFLAPQSKLQYPADFAKGNRRVELQGEAYFEVTKNPHRPFIVHTAVLDVTVLGTHFNVNSYKRNRSTTVALLEGKVRVETTDVDDDSYVLKPGEELSVNHLSHQVYQRRMTEDAATGWMNNTLVFKNDKLSDAAEKINLMYGVKIIFADQVTGDLRLYASFKNESLRDILETIKATGNISYRIEDNKVYINLNK